MLIGFHEFSYIMIFNADSATVAVYRASRTVGCDQLRAMDRLKRFRLHVVKEIYETERDYTRNLEFTVAVCQ